MNLINPEYNYYDVYKVVNRIDDEDTYKLICDKKTDGLFQLESDLFKSTIKEMQPNNINDIGALNAICRPGPLQAHLDEQYNKTKNNDMDLKEPLPGTLDIVKDTYGAIIYQEEVMAISVKVCGFNANQSDSIVRKIIGKKKKDKLAMLRRMMIYGKINQEGPDGWHDNDSLPWYDPNRQYGDEIDGALKHGYTYKQMDDFFNLLMGFAEYCFNKSHAMCYAYIGYVTGFLKAHYPLQFMTALLSMQKDQDKIEHYIEVARDLHIDVMPPDINISGRMFTIQDNNIYFGIGSIKGVGEAAIPEIIEHKPYTSFSDFYNRTNHTLVKKNVLDNLICSGCFDSMEPDRHKLLNELVSIKNLDNNDSIAIKASETYDRLKCIKYEKELLGMSITHRSEWSMVEVGEQITLYGSINNLTERADKRGKLMAFIDFVSSDDSEISCVIFASNYDKCRRALNPCNTNDVFAFTGIKNEKGSFQVSSVAKVKDYATEINRPFAEFLCE